MGVIAAAIYGLAGFMFALFLFSAIGLPGGVALSGAVLVASFGFILGTN